jgi:hypothetical protein
MSDTLAENVMLALIINRNCVNFASMKLRSILTNLLSIALSVPVGFTHIALKIRQSEMPWTSIRQRAKAKRAAVANHPLEYRSVRS